MSKANPTLSSKGWIETPIEIVKYVIGDYMVADHNQSSLLPQVRCFMMASGKFNNNPIALCNTVKDDMEFLLKDIIQEVEIIVNQTPRLDGDGLPTSAYDVDIVVTSPSFSENQNQAHLSYKAYIKDGFVNNFVFNYTEDKI